MPNASLVWEIGSCGRRRSERSSPVAFSCESSSISSGAVCTRLFARPYPLGTQHE